MAVALALASAVAYGVSDFAGGLASRSVDARLVTAIGRGIGLITAVIAVILHPGAGANAHALAWGTVSGLGGVFGALLLYRGLAAAQMSVVATTSAVVAAVVPVLVGLALGDELTLAAGVGIAIAVPAIAMVSWQPSDPASRAGPDAPTGVIYGVLAGAGFALTYVALDRAGTDAGAWPLLPGLFVGLLVMVPLAARRLHTAARPSHAVLSLIVGAGALNGIAVLLVLVALDHGALAIVAVLGSLYPAVTVGLARVFLAERWSALQTAGLVAAAGAVVLVALG